MKRFLKLLSLMMVLALLILPGNVSAVITDDYVEIDTEIMWPFMDVNYYLTITHTGEALIHDIVVDSDVTEPIHLEIPEFIPYEYGHYRVTSISPIKEYHTPDNGEAYNQYEKIASVTFEGDVPLINGNLYGFYKTVQAGTIFTDLPATLQSMPASSKEYPTIPAFISNNYNHDSNGDGTNDTYYAGANLVRVDPAYEGDLTVLDGTVSILSGAFWGCRGLEDVTIPDSVEWIGTSAFTNSSVTSVNIPLGMMEVGNDIQPWTFQNCDKLTTVTFPETEEYVCVGLLAFAGCESLTGFDFSHISTLDTCAFAYAFADGVEIDLKDAIHAYVYSSATSHTPAVFLGSGIGKVTLGANHTAVSSWEFYNCDKLTDVVFHENTAQIGSWAFANCTALTGDILKDSNVVSVEHRGLANTGITELTIPASMTSMAGGALAGNEQLETINYYAGNMNLTLFSILLDCTGQNLFPVPYAPARDLSTWQEYTALKTLNIYALPSNPYVFQGMEYLQTVNFHCDVTAFLSANFQFCPSLKTVTLSAPEKLTAIGQNVFEGCLNLKDFPFEELVNLETIGSRAFFLTSYNSDTTANVVSATTYAAMSEERKSWGLEGELDLSGLTKLTSVNISAFYNQYNVTKLHLPENLVSYGSGLGSFQGMANLEELILEGNAPSGFLNLQFFAGETDSNGTSFHTGLKSITVKGNVPSGTLFFGMKNLETVNLPEVTEIYYGAFMNCTALTTVNAPNVETVRSNAFMNTGLTSVTLKSGVTYEPNVFRNCAKLTQVTAEEGVTMIPSGMFMNCTALTSVTAPGVTVIGSDAFMNTGLEEVVIQKGVSYGSGAFRFCKDLTTVVVEEGVESLADFLLEGSENLKDLSLPSTLKKIGWGTFKASGLEQVIVPASVEVIDDDAFRGSAKAIVLEGSPVIEITQGEDYQYLMYEEENSFYPIEADATVYYANDDAKTAAEVYAQTLSLEDLAIKPCGQMDLTATLEQDKLLVGAELAGLTVKLNGTELEATQFATDYDAEDTTLGERTITVTISDEALKKASVDLETVSATGFNGQKVEGQAGSVIDADSIQATVKVIVVDHLEHNFAMPSEEMAEAATCCDPAKYYAQCSFAGCTEINRDILIEGEDLDPENHTGELTWAKTETTHKQTYSCCKHELVPEAPHVDTDPKDHECDVCGENVGKHEAAEGSHDCEYCGKPASECVDEGKDHECDVCGENVGKHEAAEGSHDCEYCGKPASECVDEGKDHECDVCGENVGEHEAAEGSHDCEYCGKPASECTDEGKDHECDICGEAVGKHEDTDKDHDCEYGCSETIGSCEDKDNNGKCDYGCGKEFEVEPEPTKPEPTEPEPTEPDDTKHEVIRIFGDNRFTTAIKVADELKANLGIQKFPVIILASGADYADALSGSYLAAVEKAPILLTYKDKENALALDYIRANLEQSGKVYILGGTAAVSQKVDDALASYGIEYERLAGENRFETNLAILKEAGIRSGDTVLVATGSNFADCLSASAVGKPIVLTHKKLFDSQKNFLQTLKGEFCIIGGESAVSKDIADALAGYGKVTRLSGANRFETSVLVAQTFFPNAESAVLAYAANYPDGLCGGPLAFFMDAPLILTMSKYEAKAIEHVNGHGIVNGVVLGGEKLISNESVRAIFGMDQGDSIVVK